MATKDEAADAKATANRGKSEHALREERILSFWQESKIFEKTLNKPHSAEASRGKGDFVFFEGPPTLKLRRAEGNPSTL